MGAGHQSRKLYSTVLVEDGKGKRRSRKARNQIDDRLNLAAGTGCIYSGGSGQNRRLGNQAFFTRIRIGEYKQIDAVANMPFNVVLDSEVQQ